MSSPTTNFTDLHGSTALTGALASVLLAAAFAAGPASALPQNGSVVGGQASIQQTAPGRLDVTQASPCAAIDWQSFGIAAGEHTHFQQPAGGIALNRVTGADASEIAGRLSATGQVWLVNPNGVLFSRGAQVDVGGLVASTAGMSVGSFMAGSNRFDQAGRPDAAIINHGRISADLSRPGAGPAGGKPLVEGHERPHDEPPPGRARAAGEALGSVDTYLSHSTVAAMVTTAR